MSVKWCLTFNFGFARILFLRQDKVAQFGWSQNPLQFFGLDEKTLPQNQPNFFERLALDPSKKLMKDWQRDLMDNNVIHGRGKKKDNNLLREDESESIFTSSLLTRRKEICFLRAFRWFAFFKPKSLRKLSSCPSFNWGSEWNTKTEKITVPIEIRRCNALESWPNIDQDWLGKRQAKHSRPLAPMWLRFLISVQPLCWIHHIGTKIEEPMTLLPVLHIW